MRIKICGITRPEQGTAIAGLGATALGFILVPSSPRYVTPETIAGIVAAIPSPTDYIGVFVDSDAGRIREVVRRARLTGVQLHGEESPDFCGKLRGSLPGIEIVKALRVKDPESVGKAREYVGRVDTLLLDAYHPQRHGGTGHTIDRRALARFRSPLPWFLAGGLTPNNVLEALEGLSPDGIDLSSGVERSPGDKDLEKVALLFARLRQGRGQN
jgi:phosphoribosylanthranilate isomerase